MIVSVYVLTYRVMPIVIAVPIVPFDAVKVDAACSHTAYNVTVVYNA